MCPLTMPFMSGLGAPGALRRSSYLVHGVSPVFDEILARSKLEKSQCFSKEALSRGWTPQFNQLQPKVVRLR